MREIEMSFFRAAFFLEDKMIDLGDVDKNLLTRRLRTKMVGGSYPIRPKLMLHMTIFKPRNMSHESKKTTLRASSLLYNTKTA